MFYMENQRAFMLIYRSILMINSSCYPHEIQTIITEGTVCLSSALSSNNSHSETDCQQMLGNFVSQKGDLGTQLLAALSQYIKFCSFKMQPLSPEDQQEVLQELRYKRNILLKCCIIKTCTTRRTVSRRCLMKLRSNQPATRIYPFTRSLRWAH